MLCLSPVAQAATDQTASKTTATEPASAPTLSCSDTIKITDRPAPELIGQMQKRLIGLGYYTGKDDSLWGPLTREALREFCTHESFARTEDLVAMLADHAAIHQAYPDWQDVLAGKDFLAWMGEQPDKDDIARVRRSGSAPAVIALLQRFNGRDEASSPAVVVETPEVAETRVVVNLPPEQPDAVVPPSRIGEGQDFVSYELSKDDLAQLKLKEQVSEIVLQIAAKPYAGREAFRAEATKALNDVPDGDEIVDDLEGNGVKAVHYRLDDNGFKALQAKAVPDYILKAIAELKDKDYTAGEFDKAVASTLSAMTQKLLDLRPEIVKFAEISPAGAVFSEDSLAKMGEAWPGDALVNALIERLAAKKGVVYQSDASLGWAVRKLITAMGKQVEEAAPLVHAEAVRESEFVIDKPAADAIAAHFQETMIPEIYLELITELEGVDYPTAELFWYAVKSRVDFAAPDNFIMRMTSEPIWRMNARKVDDELLSVWKKDELPPAILESLSDLQGTTFVSTEALESTIAGRLSKLAASIESYEQFRDRIVAQARKRHSTKSYTPIQWKGGDRGCVLDTLAGETYGLYSYWMAGEQHVIDFSVHRRVGYFGVFLDDTGEINETRHWGQEEEFQSFVREAHTYCSKADLVVYRDTWSDWLQLGPSTRQMFFKRAAESITRLISQPLTDDFSRTEPYLTLGATPEPVMGDGITLYFPGYPQDKEAVAELIDFIRLLHDRMLAHGRKYSLNLMFDSTELGTGVYDYLRLLLLKLDIEREGQIDSLFLVLLHEPTTRDKKVVRRNIENNIHGEERRELLRNIAMVISYDGKSVEQLQDDVIYANDSFAGIGFWTQPVMPEAASVSRTLRGFYLTGEAGLTSGLCEFICPHRWAFRIAWGSFCLLMLLSFVLYLLVCEWRTFLQKHFIAFMAVTVLPFVFLTAALMSCDPAWAGISRGNTPLVVLIAGILAYSLWKYRDMKQQASLP
ncbi:MAG: hypothetical protein AUK36_03555 [Zetaproteobacteria bacterium CG2_30_59_37]|nr:MAG: hypothetical protein AUK36_03555 [Zetaproteobacteria bacterium CG2_30_59_37]